MIGPTGAGLGQDGVLYVADTLDNRIAAIPDALFRGFSAGTGFTVSRGHHLNGELGLVIAPGGDILTVNCGNGNLVEVTPSGAQIAVRQLDSSGSPPGAGALFGLAVKPGHDAVYYVDDATNTLEPAAPLAGRVTLWPRPAGLERDTHQDRFGRERHAEGVADPVPDLGGPAPSARPWWPTRG